MKNNIFLVLLLTSFLFANNMLYAQANSQKAKEVLKQTGGVLSGIIISPFVGMFRGFSRGFLLGTDYTAELLGNKEGSVQRMIGFTSGGIISGLGAGYAGFLKGTYEGVKYGIEDPFSKENYSLGGSSLTDYELL